MTTIGYVLAVIGGVVCLVGGAVVVAALVSWAIGHVTDHLRLQRAFVDFMFARARGKHSKREREGM